MSFSTVNDIRLFYELHGPADGFPVVFINGLTADTSSWLFQVPAFAGQWRVLLYDCRGQGRSDKPSGPYPTMQHVQDLLGLLDALGLERAHIVGLSNGGAVAMNFAADHPERVAHLVLSDTFAHGDALMESKLASWLAAVEAGGALLRFDVATPWVWGRDFLAGQADILAQMRAKASQANQDAVCALIQGIQGYDITSRLPDIQSPTLVLVGEEDVLTPPWYARELAQEIRDARLVIVPEAGHALPIEQPMVFNALVLSFLQES